MKDDSTVTAAPRKSPPKFFTIGVCPFPAFPDRQDTVFIIKRNLTSLISYLLEAQAGSRCLLS